MHKLSHSYLWRSSRKLHILMESAWNFRNETSKTRCDVCRRLFKRFNIENLIFARLWRVKELHIPFQFLYIFLIVFKGVYKRRMEYSWNESFFNTNDIFFFNRNFIFYIRIFKFLLHINLQRISIEHHWHLNNNMFKRFVKDHGPF